jgi:spore coat protein U-like protein
MRQTTRTATVLGLMGGLTLAAGSLVSAAGSAQTTLSANAQVAKNCTITTASVNFDNYDPVVVNATAPKDGTGSVTVACTNGASATIALGTGSHASGSTRRLSDGGANYLTYELYQTAGTTVWGDAGSAMVTYNATSKAPTTITVFGRIPASQDVPAGTYSDSVLATINF